MNRRFMLCLIVILIFSELGKSQNVFPLYSDNPSWNVLERFWLSGSTKTYEYDSEISVCGQIYSKISFEQFDTIGYFRSDSIRAYFRTSTECSDKEYLIYDYSMNIGDTVFVGYDVFVPNVPGKDTAAFMLVNIDTINYFGINRRKYELLYDPFNGGQNPLSTPMYWIEGVGSQTHPFYPFRCLWDGCESGNRLLCYHSADIQLYQDQDFNTCDTSIVASIIEKTGEEIKIYPNPFITNITIEIEPDKIQGLKLYDLRGQELMSFKIVKDKWIHLVFDEACERGVYMLQLQMGERNVSTLIMKN